MELGGEEDTIHDSEELRDRLLKVAFGVWDHIKNHGDYGAENWELDWVGFLPGKRESRRYLGAYILTQNDVRAEGRFDDIVAYGGWTMDDHNPAGMLWRESPTIHHPAPSPYGIPYRSLYSRNIENLMFAGRNISVTHAALSSTRVMATCGICGQAAGTAAAIAIKNNLTPAGVYEQRLAELQQDLMDDDCFIPWHRRNIPELSANAVLTASEGDPEPLRNGFDRPTRASQDSPWQPNDWACQPGGFVQYTFDKPVALSRARIVFDSNLNRKGLGETNLRFSAEKNCLSNYPLHNIPRHTPETLVRAFRLEALVDGRWQTCAQEDENFQRLVKIPLEVTASAIRLVPLSTWGDSRCNLFAFDVQ